MKKSERTTLILFALFFGASIPFSMLLFGVAVGDIIGFRDLVLLVVATLAIALPLLLPAFIPEKYKIASLIFRWLAVIILLIPIYFYFSSELFRKAIEFIKQGSFHDVLFHLPIFMIVITCCYCIWLLIKTDLKTRSHIDFK